MIIKYILKYWLRQEKELCILLGPFPQKGSPIAFVKTEKVWEQESLKKKIKSLLSFKWNPSERLLENVSKEVFFEEIFGYPSDYNEDLFKINYWHNTRVWDLSKLTDHDGKKAESLAVLGGLLSTKHRNLSSDYLHLHLSDKAPMVCPLLHPMVVKIPVTSIQYCIQIHNDLPLMKLGLQALTIATILLATYMNSKIYKLKQHFLFTN